MLVRCTACAHAPVVQCAHQPSSAASADFLCSASFCALHFFCAFFYYSGAIPREACV